MDPNDQKQVADWQKEQAMLRDQLQKLHNRTNEAKLKQKRVEAALEDLSTVPKDRNAYIQVGRMFMLQPRDEMETSLKVTADQRFGEIGKLQTVVKRLEEKMVDVQSRRPEILG